MSDRKTTIDGDQITDETITKEELDIANTAFNKATLSYDSSVAKFLWSKKRWDFANIYTVSSASGHDFSTLQEAITFLSESGNMLGPVKLILEAETFYFSDTLVIDLPYSLSIEGAGYDLTWFCPSYGIVNKPIFEIKSSVAFYTFSIDSSTLENYGTLSGEDAFKISSDNIYFQIEDSGIYSFYCGINLTSNAEIWIFDSEIDNCISAGIRINTTSSGSICRISETGFINNFYGIDLKKGTSATASIELCVFEIYSSQYGINYDGTNYDYLHLTIKNNIKEENGGLFYNGFDFARTDGRDADVEFQGNVPFADRQPHASLGVLDNSTQTTISVKNTWYKAVFTNGFSATTKFKIENNKFTYQPTCSRDIFFWAAGTVAGSGNKIGVCVLKNGISTTRYGEVNIKTGGYSNPNNFACCGYISNLITGDYLELYLVNYDSTNYIVLQDINFLVDAR